MVQRYKHGTASLQYSTTDLYITLQCRNGEAPRDTGNVMIITSKNKAMATTEISGCPSTSYFIHTASLPDPILFGPTLHVT